VSVDVLLLDGENRSTLAACRSLGQHGLNVAVVGPRGCISHASKYCTEKVVLELGRDPAPFLSQLKALVIELSPRLFLPMSDRTLGIISEDHELFGLSPLPAKQALDTVQDKDSFLALAKKLSIKSPEGRTIYKAEDLEGWSTFPAVLKTGRAGLSERAEKPPVRYFDNLSTLKEFVTSNPGESPWMLQEKITGPGVGVFILAKAGEVITVFSHQRILDKPPSGGVSVLSKSIDRSAAPVSEAYKLIENLKWTGVAMVEFKISATTGQPYLMEINPRFWGSLELAIRAGVNFPLLLWLMHIGQLDSEVGRKALSKAQLYLVGKHLRWDLGTLDHLLIRVKQEGLSGLKDIILNNNLKLFNCKDLVRETLRSDDPKPFLAELKNYVANLVK